MSDEQTTRRREVGAQVRRVREAMGITIDQAAESAPMSPVTWSSIEAGRSVKRFSYARAEGVLSWGSGSIERYVVSGESTIPGVGGAADTGGALRSGPNGLIDSVLELDRPDATKVALIKAIRAGGDTLGVILGMDDVSDAEKVELIGALREAQGLAGEAGEGASRAESA